MTKVVDMDKIVEGDNSTLEGTGVVKSDRPTTVDAKELPEGTMMEITQPGTNKKFTYPAMALAGGDYHKIIQASDGIFSDQDIKRYYDIVMKMDWQDGWYSSEQMKKEAKTPGYKHIHLGGSDTKDVDYEIEQDWVKEIWDKVDPENVKLLIPLPSDPLVVIYVTSTTFPSCSFFPNIPSPKITSYLSLSTS